MSSKADNELRKIIKLETEKKGLGKIFTIGEVAKKLHVSVQTLKRWDKDPEKYSDKLKSHGHLPNGYRYYTDIDLSNYDNQFYKTSEEMIDDMLTESFSNWFEKLNAKVTIPLTQNYKSELDKKAKYLGMSLSNYLRECIEIGDSVQGPSLAELHAEDEIKNLKAEKQEFPIDFDDDDPLKLN